MIRIIVKFRKMIPRLPIVMELLPFHKKYNINNLKITVIEV